MKMDKLIDKIITLIIDFFKDLFNINTHSIYNNKTINSYQYQQKQFLTNYERYFFQIFRDLENELPIKIHPQLNLNSIIDKIDNTKYRNELFRNIDFAIFDKDYSTLLLLIEINDKTHQSKKRRERDLKVEDICAKAGIKLIKFYSNYSNEKEYVKNRIKKELNLSNDSQNNK